MHYCHNQNLAGRWLSVWRATVLNALCVDFLRVLIVRRLRNQRYRPAGFNASAHGIRSGCNISSKNDESRHLSGNISSNLTQ